MSVGEDVWRRSTDEQLIDAARVLGEYTDDGRAIIRAELLRRGLPEPIPEPILDVPASTLASPWRRLAASTIDAAAILVVAAMALSSYQSGSILYLLVLGGTQIALLMRRARKVFVGYSDVTALLWFHLQHGLMCFHGPMIERRIAAGEAGYDAASFLGAVQGSSPMGALAPTGLDVLKPGEATGVLVGGTLTQMAASLGTPWACDPPPGCLLFIEDVGERPYRIDRMLTQLAQAGILARANGLIIGELPACDEPGGDPCIRDVLIDFFHDFRGPILFGFPSGHSSGPTWTLPFGVHARIVTSPPTLDIIEAAVE